MSKAAKQSLFILIALILVSGGYAVVKHLESAKLTEDLSRVESDLRKSEKREKKALTDAQRLNGELDKAQKDKSKLTKKVKQTEQQAEQLLAQVAEISDERDKIKRRMESVKGDRNKLQEKVNELSAQIQEQANKLASTMIAPPPTMEKTPSSDAMDKQDKTAAMPRYPAGGNSAVDEEYWASLLREKASLEVDIETLKTDLAQKSVEIVGYKQKNADLQIQLDTIAHDKTEVEQEIKFKTDLINNLSLELARTKNDKKFVAARVTKLTDDNRILRGDLKKLVSVKGSLEKRVVKLSQDKGKIEKKLVQTENVIQSKIDEIWEVKESIDRSFQANKLSPSRDEIELPPIVVNSNGPAVSFNEGASSPGFDGKVVSVNNENNFVIVDIGEGEGVRLGDYLSVYRNSKYVARLEVIQVRKDICAADIKDQWSKITTGDIVR